MRFKVGEEYIGTIGKLTFRLIINSTRENNYYDIKYKYLESDLWMSYYAHRDEMKDYNLRKLTKLEKALK